MIPKFTIARIMEESRIDEVIGEYVHLKKRGTSLIGNCPFHNEKTPSFNVSVSKGIYKCFGCGKAGNVVTFLMENQQMSYVEALRFLAKKYNIEIAEENVSDEQRKEEEIKQSQTESILIANAFAQRFFTDYLLHNEKGGIGLAYFRERGFSNHMIEKFQLGFAPDAGSELTDAALQAGYQLEVLKKAGLTSPKENSKYDFFRNRVMFPIHNMTGKVIAFGGRIMVKDEKAPKYVNTPESDVYVKSKILYGIYQARNSIRRLDECLLVEGYTDVISLVQAGIENVAASSGTSLTTDQIKLIKRLTQNITVLYDGDAAGIKAALRGTDMILEEGMNVRVVILPDQEDPDSYVRKAGAEAFTKFIKENRKDLILFKAALFAEEAKSDPIRKAELIRDIVSSIGKVPDPIQRSIYLQQCSERFGMQEQLLITEVNKIRRERARQQHKEEVAPEVEARDMSANAAVHQEQLRRGPLSIEFIERDVVTALMEFGTWDIYLGEGQTEQVARFIIEDMQGIDFQSQYKYVYELIRSEFEQGQIHEPNFYTLHSDPDVSNTAIRLLTDSSYDNLSPGWWRKYEVILPDKMRTYNKNVISSTMRLKQFKNMETLRLLEEMMKEEKDEEKLLSLMKKHKLLMQQKKEFALATGTNVYRPI